MGGEGEKEKNPEKWRSKKTETNRYRNNFKKASKILKSSKSFSQSRRISTSFEATLLMHLVETRRLEFMTLDLMLRMQKNLLANLCLRRNN